MAAPPFTRSVRYSILLTAALAATLALPVFATGTAPDTNKKLLNPKTEQPGLKVGELAPTLTLRTAHGEKIDLGEYYKANAPVVVTFYRGGWCPFCNKALKNWNQKMDELISAGGAFIAISPETKEHALKSSAKIGGDYVTLVDKDGAAMRAFKLGFAVDDKTKSRYEGFGIDLDNWNSNGKWELPAPATYIIDEQGVVRWVFASWDYTKRANPDEVIAEVKKLTHGMN